MATRHWRRGDSIVLRPWLTTPRLVQIAQTIHGDSSVMALGWPHVVVDDSDELIVLYRPEGTLSLSWNVHERRLREETQIPRGYSLRLLYPGKAYAVTLFFDGGNGVSPFIDSYFGEGSGHFRGWKVDVVTPVRRTEHGYDSVDQLLDIMVRPDRTYYWKDEGQLASMVTKGLYTIAQADEIRLAGEEVIPLIEASKSPFDDSWTDWSPTADLVLGEVRDGWQYQPDDEQTHEPQPRQTQ
jgi:hypothetical protein